MSDEPQNNQCHAPLLHQYVTLCLCAGSHLGHHSQTHNGKKRPANVRAAAAFEPLYTDSSG